MANSRKSGFCQYGIGSILTGKKINLLKGKTPRWRSCRFCQSSLKNHAFHGGKQFCFEFSFKNYDHYSLLYWKKSLNISPTFLICRNFATQAYISTMDFLSNWENALVVFWGKVSVMLNGGGRSWWWSILPHLAWTKSGAPMWSIYWRRIECCPLFVPLQHQVSISLKSPRISIFQECQHEQNERLCLELAKHLTLAKLPP